MVLKQAGRMSNVAIAERLGVTEGAIRYRLKRMRAKAVDKRTQRPSRVSEYEGVIGSWVEDYAGRSHRPAIKALYERLVEHHGFPLSYDALRRHVKKRHPGFFGRKVRTRIETPPGLLALVDWKEKVAVRLGTPERWETLHCFVYVLGFSRKTVAVWSGSKDLASWIRAHAEAFRATGGLPRFLRPDCLKDAVVAWNGQKSTITPGYERYLQALGVSVFPARPGTASDKGKVEKKIRDIFDHLDLRGSIFTDIQALQEQTDRVIRTLESRWRCGATGLTVQESFAYERAFLETLPVPLPAVPVQERRCLVRDDKTVFFQGNWYQVEKAYVGKRILCTFTGQEIILRHAGEEIGRFAYLPEAKGMVRLQEGVLEDPDVPISDTVRGWALEVARRQVAIYNEIIMRRQA